MGAGGTAVLVQARMGSERLPAKSLRGLQGRPMVAHVLERAVAIGAGQVWLVTSINDRDTPLAELAQALGLPVHRGSEWDVLQRMSDAAREAEATTVMRLTGDCPLLAPDVSRDVLDLYLSEAGDHYYASNDTTRSGWPDGLDTEVFPAHALHRAAAVSMSAADREHVTPWIRRSLNNLVFTNRTEDWRRVKLSVDRVEDFDRVACIMAHRGTSGSESALDWPVTRAAFKRWIDHGDL